MQKKIWNWWSKWKDLEKIGCLKKMDIICEIYALLKKCINDNQRVTWQVEFGPHGDTPHNNFTFINKSLIKWPNFIEQVGSLLQWSYFINENCMQNK